MKVITKSLAAALFLLPGAATSVHASTNLVICEAGRWEGHRTGFRGSDGENGITYPSIIMAFDDEAKFGDVASIQFGANYASPEGLSITGVVTFRSESWYQKDYIIIHSQPQQIAETYTIDLETADVVFTQTIGDGSGVNIDAFKRSCSMQTLAD